MSTRTSTLNTVALRRVDSASVTRAPRYRLDVHSPSRRCSVLRAKGDLDMTARAEFAATLGDLAHSGDHVVVDLSEVTFMYSEVASTLADADHIRPGLFHIVAPTRQVRMLLDILAPGLDVTADAAPCDAGTAPAA
ncbi:STAS domain-containing protein [Rhodococcus sp. B50]|uniref:STAS domain-containing protein n=1 Tax=Rhodococcus sp. B50 TaxID=2682847 RepID=UPI0019F28B02|nr:STAS domain-containing protein [Rhodococcus sp. B50]MBS9375235.1 hypothetical protein [Rhodococcus sp. B50]